MERVEGVEDEIREVTRGQILQFVGHGEESIFYSKSNGKPWEGFAQENDKLLKVHFVCCIAHQLKRGKVYIDEENQFRGYFESVGES